MDPNDINLKDLNKVFEYERLSRELDSCNDIDTIKNVAKSYIKLYLATLETISNFK
jgi:hypothetical protein